MIMEEYPVNSENSNSEQIIELLAMLDSKSQEERLNAIRLLGEFGDLTALIDLRKRLGPANQELQCLLVAIGKLKRRLKAK